MERRSFIEQPKPISMGNETKQKSSRPIPKTIDFLMLNLLTAPVIKAPSSDVCKIFDNVPNLRRLSVLLIDLRSQLVPSELYRCDSILGFANFTSVDFPQLFLFASVYMNPINQL
jgi:hypothetical protein